MMEDLDEPEIDYWLSKLFFDLQTDRALAIVYGKERDAVLARYPLSDSVLTALRNNKVAYLAGLTNGFLLRYYFLIAGMPDQTFIDGLQTRKCEPAEVTRGSH